jgi:hypothetical protein
MGLRHARCRERRRRYAFRKEDSCMKRLTLALVALLLAFAPASPAAAQGPRTEGALSAIPISGTFTDASGAGTFAGTLHVDRFASRDRALVAVGSITGTLTDATGTARSVTDQQVVLPVNAVAVSSGARASAASDVTPQQTEGQCQILHLEFGGITLNVLGIELMLSPISLDLSLGGLLGGILCGLLGALAGGAPPPAQANMLNTALGLP